MYIQLCMHRRRKLSPADSLVEVEMKGPVDHRVLRATRRRVGELGGSIERTTLRPSIFAPALNSSSGHARKQCRSHLIGRGASAATALHGRGARGAFSCAKR